jgi:hypothetical protein
MRPNDAQGWPAGNILGMARIIATWANPTPTTHLIISDDLVGVETADHRPVTDKPRVALRRLV